MDINKNTYEYLRGKKFSNGLNLTISEKESSVLTRFDLIKELATNKKIIHLGFGDHTIDNINKKLKSNNWLHSKLVEVSNRCLGIDIKSDVVAYANDILEYKDVLCADIIEKQVNEITDSNWDFMIMGEILEHIDNPILFLKTIKEKYKNNIKKIIITVPNAFSLFNYKSVFSHIECINSDHRYWFTPYTLAKCVVKSEMTVDSFYFCQEKDLKFGWKGKFKPKNIIRKQRLKKYPAFRDIIVMIVDL